MDRGVTSPGYVCSFLRLASSFGTVLSAVLTIGCYCRERFTQPTGMSSTPLRFGPFSPTFFNEVVIVGIPSSVYLVLGLTCVSAIDIMSSPKKGKAPPEAIQIHFEKGSVPSLFKGKAAPIFGLASPHPNSFDFAKNQSCPGESICLFNVRS